MAAIDDTRRRAAQLRDQARSVKSQSRAIQTQTHALTAVTAGINDQLAVTLDLLAGQQPWRAGFLRDKGEAARGNAARERGRIMRPVTDGPAAPVIEERDRIAAQLQETIIRRIFAAGLSLESAAGLTANPQVRWRIEAAVTELDEVIREIRDTVFRESRHADSRGLTLNILDLSDQLATTASIRISSAGGTAGGSAALLHSMQMILSLIGEHATPTCVDISADTGSYSLTIDAVHLAPGESPRERASWLSAVEARAAEIGVGVGVQPVPGGTRFICELPAGSVR